MLSVYLSMVDTDEERNTIQTIYKEHRDRMFAVAMRYLHNQSDAEDAVHEAFLRIVSGKTNIFEIPPEKMTAYTNIIIRNISVNMLRLRNREQLYEDNMNETEEIAFEDDVISQVSRNELVGFILKLPKGQRDALYAKIVLGVSSAAGAEILNISETAFRQRIYAAKQSIKAFLEGEK